MKYINTWPIRLKRAWAYQTAVENTISLIRVQKWNRRENKEWKGREHKKGENWHKPLLLLEVERVYWISSKIHFIFSIRSDWYTLWRFMPCCHCFLWPIWWLWSCSNIQWEENKCAFSLERRTHMFSAWQVRFIWRRCTHKNGSALTGTDSNQFPSSCFILSKAACNTRWD